MASVTAESDEACAGREVVIADGVEHGNRRLLVHRRPDGPKLNGLGWPRPWNALRGRPRGRRQRLWLPTSWNVACPKARSGTASAWPRSEPSRN